MGGAVTLRSLAIRNFALIEELQLELAPGLTAFTGETGAGKSILVEALGFLLGERGNSDWLRAGSERLEVSGVFDARGLDDGLRARWAIGDRLELRRELDAGGKSKATLNGKSATIAAVAEIGVRLADFHGQHEHQSLLRPETQLDLLDDFAGLDAPRQKTAQAHGRWKGLLARRDALSLSEEERLRRIDLYRFQVSEIDAAALRMGEDEELAAQLPKLKNAGRLGALAEQSYALLYEQEGSAQEILAKSQQAFSEMSRLDPALESAVQSLERARAAVEDAVSALSAYRESAEAGPETLDRLLGRQDALARLKKKYGATIADILATRERTAAELSALDRHAERAEEIEAEIEKTRAELAALSETLHQLRAKAAKKLSDKITAEIRALGMPNARLSIAVEMEEGMFSASGSDRIEFLIAPNPGEGLKSLRSIASGGELSRTMLALKTVLAGQDRVGLLVFDEVDTGIGGVVARAVGQKLAQLGRSRQVFAVTHLPQVACFASNHFQVSKEVLRGRTTARVERLDGDLRLEAIARMLGGRQATEASRRHAQELMESV